MAKSLKREILLARQKYQQKLNGDADITIRKKSTSDTYKEKRKEATVPHFSERYEEDLRRKLFNDVGEVIVQEVVTEESVAIQAHNKTEAEWDIRKDEQITYFDPTLSYEVTGYKPITMSDGFDFDPTPFCAVGQVFERTGSYTKYPKGYKAYNDFWKEQLSRCKEGYTVNGYTVTGDHYFFLNFYRLQVPGDKAGNGRSEAFPSFHAKQYEFFHYIALCEATKKDAALLKARGLGFSEMMAVLAVRPFITTRNFRTILTTFSDALLDPLLAKSWFQLDWLNLNTDGGMRRLRQKVDNAKHKRASRLNREGTEFGRRSEIEGVVADTADKLRGHRVDRLIFDEAGSNKHLIDSWLKSNALVELGGYKWAIRVAGGTGGDSGPALEGLSKIFSNPIAYNVLPYKNIDTVDGNPQLTGFFIPAHKFSLMPEFLDCRGVTDDSRFKQYYLNGRAQLSGNDLLTYSAEHCFTPNEALFKEGENMFDAVAISDRLTQIRILKEGLRPNYVSLLWDRLETDELVKLKVVSNAASKIQIYEHPKRDDNGDVFKNLYVAGIDSIDQGRNDSATNVDVSDFCIVIKRRAFGLQEPKYVAMYKDRPNDIREAYDNAMKLLTYYNCQALLEHTKISILTYFKEKKKQNLFMRRPSVTMSDSKKTNSRMYGVPATEAVIKHGLELINNFVNDHCYSVDIDEMLEQLLKYSYENKRKFDIIAAIGMAEIADEELMGIAPKTFTEGKSEWKNFGYYTDTNGNKQYGIIPDGYRW